MLNITGSIMTGETDFIVFVVEFQAMIALTRTENLLGDHLSYFFLSFLLRDGYRIFV